MPMREQVEPPFFSSSSFLAAFRFMASWRLLKRSEAQAPRPRRRGRRFIDMARRSSSILLAALLVACLGCYCFVAPATPGAQSLRAGKWKAGKTEGMLQLHSLVPRDRREGVKTGIWSLNMVLLWSSLATNLKRSSLRKNEPHDGELFQEPRQPEPPQAKLRGGEAALLGAAVAVRAQAAGYPSRRNNWGPGVLRGGGGGLTNFRLPFMSSCLSGFLEACVGDC